MLHSRYLIVCIFQVLKKIIKLLPRQPAVKEFVVDFEQGVWKAVQNLILNATIKGCSFHWVQAIWRHVQSLGSGNKGLYTIAPLLIEEANLLSIQIQLVSEGKLKKLQCRHVRTTQQLLFNQWEQYVEGSISVGRLLRLCGRLVYIPDQ